MGGEGESAQRRSRRETLSAGCGAAPKECPLSADSVWVSGSRALERGDTGARMGAAAQEQHAPKKAFWKSGASTFGRGTPKGTSLTLPSMPGGVPMRPFDHISRMATSCCVACVRAGRAPGKQQTQKVGEERRMTSGLDPPDERRKRLTGGPWCLL